MPELIPKKEFRNEIRRTLSHLYEPFELRNSLLAQILPLDQTLDKAHALRNILQEAIRQNKPDSSVSPDSSGVRAYEVLYYRYIEQSSLKEVAAEMALSTRQVHRIESIALQDLTDYLARKYHIDLADDLDGQAGAAMAAGGGVRPVEPTSNQAELDWIKKSFRSEEISFTTLFESIVSTVSPMIRPGALEIEGSLRAGIKADETTLRQALVNLLIAAFRCSADGCVLVKGEVDEDQLRLVIQANQDPGEIDGLHQEIRDIIELAEQLLVLNDGVMEIESEAEKGKAFRASVTLPVTKKVLVMVIDDNVDTLRLMERYLDGTRYQFLGVHDPKEVAAFVQEKRPQVIILDVMMPEIDGWQMLNQLKENGISPRTQVIISTILPQESLALAFGAAGFLRKPVSQERFLAVLNQLVGQSGPEPS